MRKVVGAAGEDLSNEISIFGGRIGVISCAARAEGGWESQLIVDHGCRQGRSVFVQVEQKSHFWQML